MARSKYLYQSLLFSSINSNSFCDMFSCKNDKNKKLQINEQDQNQNSNQQEDKKPENPGEPNPNQEPNKKLEDPKKIDKIQVQSEKGNNIYNIVKTLKKTYNNVGCCDLKNDCCIYYCRFNKGDDAEKTDAKGNEVKKHYVYIYVSYLDNYKLIAESKYVTSDREDLVNNILKEDDLEFKLLCLKSSNLESVDFKLRAFKDILTKFLNLCDSEGILIKKIQEPLITISLKIYWSNSDDKEYKLWLGLINNNLYYETKSETGKCLLIPMNVDHYERLESYNFGSVNIYAYSNDDKEKDKLYFYRLEKSPVYNIGKYPRIAIKPANSDYFIINKNNINDIRYGNQYTFKIVRW